MNLHLIMNLTHSLTTKNTQDRICLHTARNNPASISKTNFYTYCSVYKVQGCYDQKKSVELVLQKMSAILKPNALLQNTLGKTPTHLVSVYWLKHQMGSFLSLNEEIALLQQLISYLEGNITHSCDKLYFKIFQYPELTNLTETIFFFLNRTNKRSVGSHFKKQHISSFFRLRLKKWVTIIRTLTKLMCKARKRSPSSTVREILCK